MRMNVAARRLCTTVVLLSVFGSASVSGAQVSPAEILSPQLKALESEYLQDLINLNRQIAAKSFPFPFVLSKYVDLDPKEQEGADTRGIEFVNFHDHTVLKISGNYNVTFSARQLNRNQRADRVFTEVIHPVLGLLPKYFSGNSDFDEIGFEISYHVSEASGKADYEGRENLVVVIPLRDALRFPQVGGTDERQRIVDASEVYVSGKRFGLALGQVDPLPIGEIAETKDAQKDYPHVVDNHNNDRTLRVAGLESSASPESYRRANPARTPQPLPSLADPSSLVPADVDVLQAKNQSALDEFGSLVGASLHQANSTSPSLALFRNSLYLQLTLQNPEMFDKEKTSLYKRAALSFDTFLAPHLADISRRVPAIGGLKGLDITVLVSVSPGKAPSEAVEFVCPVEALRRFTSYDISNQDLINQGMVIVNGVRIALNLQLVE